MEFKEGTHVYTADSEDVGSVERVVLDPRTDEVMGIVVRQGWLFTEDKVVPIGLVESATEDRITLRKSERDLQELPRFEETYYVPAEREAVIGGAGRSYIAGDAAPFYAYPPLGTAWWGYGGYYDLPPTDYVPGYVERTHQNIPEGTVAIKEGARVMGKDGEHVGNIEKVFIDSATKHATHVVISKGILFKERKLIPTNWINVAGENEVMLTVNSGVVENLIPYRD
jgi:uncharacterized protein YrrD